MVNSQMVNSPMVNDLEDERVYTDQEGNKFVSISTKIEAEQFNMFARIAERIHQSKYVLIQHAVSQYIALMSLSVRISDTLQKACLLFNQGIHFERRFNLVNPTAKPEIQGAIFLLGDRSFKGRQPVYVDYPFMGEAEQTENVADMFDMFLDAANHELYMKMSRETRRRSLQNNWYLLVTMLTECEGIEDVEEIESTFADDRRSDWGKQGNEQGTIYRRTMVNKDTADDYLDRLNARQTKMEFGEE